MLITLQDPKGLDAQIQLLQQEIGSELGRRFAGVASDEELVICPRVYRNQAPAPGTGYIAELYLGAAEYKEVFWDDAKKLIVFFSEGAKMQHGTEDETDVALICFANVAALYPTIEHRADYEIRRDFQRLFEGVRIFGFRLLSVEIGLQNVLREYPGSRRDGRLAAVDMGSVHAFRLNLSLRFDRENCLV